MNLRTRLLDWWDPQRPLRVVAAVPVLGWVPVEDSEDIGARMNGSLPLPSLFKREDVSVNQRGVAVVLRHFPALGEWTERPHTVIGVVTHHALSADEVRVA